MGRRKRAVESLAVTAEFWRGRRVFVTGHTDSKGPGFRFAGQMGAVVTGFSLAPRSHPSLFDLAKVADRLSSVIADVNDQPALECALAANQPEIIFHLRLRRWCGNPIRIRFGHSRPMSAARDAADSVRRIPSVRASSS